MPRHTMLWEIFTQTVLKKARETSFQCGHCRVIGENENSNSTDSMDEELRTNETLDESDENPVWVTPPELRRPTLIERARNAIADLGSSAVAHSIHQPGTRSWQSLPFRIDPMVWNLFWVNMDWFISTIPEGPRALYIHAVVYTPVDPVQHIRKTIYRLITQIIPAEVRSCLSHIKHRLRFRQAGDNGTEPSRIPTNPTRSPSCTFVSQGSGLQSFTLKIFLTPPASHQTRQLLQGARNVE